MKIIDTMNILTFDTEEWFVEKAYRNADQNNYRIYDRYLNSILDLLDEQNLKATFFCVGGLTRDFPNVVKCISDRGHEIGCHSDKHLWLNTLDRNAFKEDTVLAINSLEDVVGKKVVSYRAPAFTIGDTNKWVLEVLAECGIERDASIFPAERDFGGFPNFPTDEPCLIKVGNTTIKELPIRMNSILNRRVAYLGGGYFRFFPYAILKNIVQQSNYNMAYFHISDLMYRPLTLQDRREFERIYRIPGTYYNRVSRMLKKWIGTKHSYEKMCRLITSFDFVNVEQACKVIDWNNVMKVEL